jgi:hypothetical protein
MEQQFLTILFIIKVATIKGIAICNVAGAKFQQKLRFKWKKIYF